MDAAPASVKRSDVISHCSLLEPAYHTKTYKTRSAYTMHLSIVGPNHVVVVFESRGQDLSLSFLHINRIPFEVQVALRFFLLTLGKDGRLAGAWCATFWLKLTTD